MHTILYLGLLWVLLASPAWAVTYWASPSGSDANACSAIDGDVDPSTYRTLNGARSCMVSGDTLVLKAGTYTSPVGCLPANSTLRAAVGEAAIIRPNTSTGQCSPGNAAIVVNGVNGVTVLGDRYDAAQAGTLTLDLVNWPNGNGSGISYYGTVTSGAVRGIEITNWGLGTDLLRNAIYTHSETISNLQLSHNYIHDGGSSGADQEHGIYVRGPNFVIEHNHFEGVSAYCVHAYNGSTNSNDGLIVRYNRFNRCGAYGFLLGSGDNMRAHDNIVSNSGDGADTSKTYGCFTVGFANPNTVNVYNITCYNNRGYRYRVRSGSTNIVIRNNIYYLRHASGVLDESSGGLSETHALVATSDPFMDAPNDNFSLAGAGGASDGVNDGTSTPYRSCIGTCDQGALESPVFSSCSVEDGDDTKVRVLFSTVGGAIQGSAAAQWAAVVAGAGATETAVTPVGTTRIDITLSAAVTNGQSVTIAYTRGTLTDTSNRGGLHAFARSFTAQSCTNNVGAAPAATFRQIASGWYEFYGTEAAGAAVFLCGENTNCTFFQYARVALRLKMDCNGGNCDPKTVTVRYSRNGGAYTEIPNTVDADKIVYAACPNMAHGSVTSERLTSGAGGFVAGLVLGQLVAIPNVDLAQDDEVEFAFCFGWTDATITDTYDFRLYDQAGGAINTYSVTPRATIGYPAVVNRQP